MESHLTLWLLYRDKKQRETRDLSKQSRTLLFAIFSKKIQIRFAMMISPWFWMTFFRFVYRNSFCSENMVSDRIPDRKVANIAASLVAAAATANGSIDEKERELNEVITGLQILREELIRRVSLINANAIFVPFFLWTRTLCVQQEKLSEHQFPLSRILYVIAALLNCNHSAKQYGFSLRECAEFLFLFQIFHFIFWYSQKIHILSYQFGLFLFWFQR